MKRKNLLFGCLLPLLAVAIIFTGCPRQPDIVPDLVAEARAELLAVLESARQLEEADFSSETWGPFATALAAAEDAYVNATTVEALNAAREALSDAMDSLEPFDPVVGARLALRQVLAEARQLNEEDFTSETWEPFAAALANAEDAYANATTVAALNAAREALTSAMDSLAAYDPVVGARLALRLVLLEARPRVEATYTPASWGLFAAALADAEDAYANATTVAALDTAREALLYAMGNLVERADMSYLAAAITAAQSLRDDTVVAAAPGDATIGTWGAPQESFDVFNAAIATAEGVRDNVNAAQEEVDGAESDLLIAHGVFNAARFAGTYDPAFTAARAALLSLLEDARLRAEATYTPASWGPFATARAGAEYAYANATTSAALDGAREALASAIGNLVERADVSDLVAAITAAQGLRDGTLVAVAPGDITIGTWGAPQGAFDIFNAAIATAEGVRDNLNAAQGEVNTARNNLLAAHGVFDAARFAGTYDPAFTAARTALLEILTAARSVVEDTVTPETWGPFAAALANAEYAYANATTIAELDAAREALRDAFDSLYFIDPVDAARSALGIVLASARPRVEATYTPTSWDPFATARAAAEDAYANATTVADLNAAREALSAAMDNLVERADVSDLAAAIIAAQGLRDGTLVAAAPGDINIGTWGAPQESFDVFNAAITTAENVRDNIYATQDEVDAAGMDLLAAHGVFNAARFAGTYDPALTGPRAALLEVLIIARPRVEAAYTPASWGPFATARAGAEYAYANATTVAALDAAREALSAAMAALMNTAFVISFPPFVGADGADIIIIIPAGSDYAEIQLENISNVRWYQGPFLLHAGPNLPLANFQAGTHILTLAARDSGNRPFSRIVRLTVQSGS